MSFPFGSGNHGLVDPVGVAGRTGFGLKPGAALLRLGSRGAAGDEAGGDGDADGRRGLRLWSSWLGERNRVSLDGFADGRRPNESAVNTL